MSNKRQGRAPALFDDAAFDEDFRRAADLGRAAAIWARRELEAEGVQVGSFPICARLRC